MIKTKLAITIDSITISIISAILSYLWINRYIKNAFLSFFICNLILICVFFLIFKIFTKKYNLEHIKYKDAKLAEQCFFYLKFCSFENSKNYFEKLLNAKHLQSNLFESANNYFYINLKSPLLVQDFLIANEFYLNTNKSKPLIFLSTSQTEEFKSTLALSPNQYTVYEQIEVFELMNKQKFFPIDTTPTPHKNYFSTLKSTRFNFSKNITKNRFKEFFFSGISLVLISLIVPYTSYYLIFGTILLILSIISLFRKGPQPTKQKEKLVDIINQSTHQ